MSTPNELEGSASPSSLSSHFSGFSNSDINQINDPVAQAEDLNTNSPNTPPPTD